MNILYLSQVFPPDSGASVRALEQAICLKSLHHDVTVITTMSYYPLGKVHPRYRGKYFVQEVVDGLKVVRVWSLPASNRGIIRRVLSQLSFAVASFCVAWTLKKPDLIIASTHIFAVEMAAVLFARLRRCQAMIEFRDLLPDSLALAGVSENSLRAKFLRRYFNLCFRLADYITVPHENMFSYLLRRGARINKILILPHASDRRKFQNIDPARVAAHKKTGKFLVLYAGSLSTYYDVPNILRAANILADTHSNIHFLLLGDGQDMPQLRDLQRQSGCTNATLCGLVPPEQIPEYLSACDLCLTSLISLTPLEFYRNYTTTKICEYLMAGKPILAIENFPVMGEFLRRIDAGESVQGNNPPALADAILRMCKDTTRLHHYAENARRYALDKMDRMSIVAEFESTLIAKMKKCARGKR